MSHAIAKRFAPAAGSMESRAAGRAFAFVSFFCRGALLKVTLTELISRGAASPWQASMIATRRAHPGRCRSISIGAPAMRHSMLYPRFSLGKGAVHPFHGEYPRRDWRSPGRHCARPHKASRTDLGAGIRLGRSRETGGLRGNGYLRHIRARSSG